MGEDIVVEEPSQLKDTLDAVLANLLNQAISAKNLQTKNELITCYNTYLKDGFYPKNNFNPLSFANYLKSKKDYKLKIIADCIERDFWIFKLYKISVN